MTVFLPVWMYFIAIEIWDPRMRSDETGWKARANARIDGRAQMGGATQQTTFSHLDILRSQAIAHRDEIQSCLKGVG